MRPFQGQTQKYVKQIQCGVGFDAIKWQGAQQEKKISNKVDVPMFMKKLY